LQFIGKYGKLIIVAAIAAVTVFIAVVVMIQLIRTSMQKQSTVELLERSSTSPAE